MSIRPTSSSPLSSPVRDALQSLIEDPTLDVQTEIEEEEQSQYNDDREEEIEQMHPRVANINDAAAAVADVYTHLAASQRSSSDTAIDSNILHSWQQRIIASHTYNTNTRSTIGSDDILASPEPSIAPRPHPTVAATQTSQPISNTSPTLDEQFHAARKDAEESKQPLRTAHPRASTTFAPSSSPNAAASQTRFSLHTSSSVGIQPNTRASTRVGILDSNVSRAKWLENKLFLLTSLQRSLANKTEELLDRKQSLDTDKLKCEDKLLKTLETYIRRTKRKLGEWISDVSGIQEHVQSTTERVQQELKRLDLTVDRPGVGGAAEEKTNANQTDEDPSAFRIIADQLESELSAIMAAITTHGQFNLNPTGASSSTGGNASNDPNQLPVFDPFQVARVKELEKEKSVLESKLASLEVSLVGGVDLSITATGKNSTPGVVPFHQTQELILSLQEQLDTLAAKHLLLEKEARRMETENSSLTLALKSHRQESLSQDEKAKDRQVQLESQLREQARVVSIQESQLSSLTHQLTKVSEELLQEREHASEQTKKASEREGKILKDLEQARKDMETLTKEREKELQSTRDALTQSKREQQNSIHQELRAVKDHHAQAIQELQKRFDQERAELQYKLATQKKEEQQARDAHKHELTQLHEKYQQREKSASENQARMEHQWREEIQALKRQLDQSSKDLSASQRTVAELTVQRDSDRSSMEHSKRHSDAQVGKLESQLIELKRSLARESESLHTKESALAQAQTQLTQSRLESETFRHDLTSAQDKLKQANESVEDLRKQLSHSSESLYQLSQERSDLRQQLADTTIKLASQVAQGENQSVANKSNQQILESTRSSLEKRVRELEEALRSSDAELRRVTTEKDALLATSDHSRQATEYALQQVKSQLLHAVQSKETEVARITALQKDILERNTTELKELRENMDAQVSLHLTKILLAYQQRMDRLNASVRSKIAVLGEEVLERDLAKDAESVEEMKRHISPPSASSASAVIDSSSSVPSLSLARDAFESSFHQVESSLCSFWTSLTTSKEQLTKHYQAMIVQMKQRFREEVRNLEQDHSSKLHLQSESHQSAMRAQEEESHDVLLQTEGLLHEREKELELLKHSSQQALSDALAECSRKLEQQREEAEEQFSALIQEFKEEHLHDCQVWEQEKQAFEQQRQKRQEEWEQQYNSTLQQHEKALSILRAERERLQSQLDEIDATTQQTVKQLSKTQQTAWEESQEILQRKHRLELEAAQNQHTTEMRRAKEAFEDQLAREKQQAEDRLTHAQQHYTTSLELLREQHTKDLDTLKMNLVARVDQERQEKQELLEQVARDSTQEKRQMQQQYEQQLQRLLQEQSNKHARTVAALKSFLREHQSILQSRSATGADPRQSQRNDRMDVEREVREAMRRLQGEAERSSISSASEEELKHDSDASSSHAPSSGSSSTRSVRFSGVDESDSGDSAIGSGAEEHVETDLLSLSNHLRSSLDSFRSQVSTLQTRLQQSYREKDRLVVEMNERLERETLELRTSETTLKARNEELTSQLQTTKSYAEDVKERWKRLQEEMDELTAKHALILAQFQSAKQAHAEEMKALKNKFESELSALEAARQKERQELRTEVVDAEFQLHKARERAAEEDAALREAHALEIKTLKEQHSRALEEALAKHKALIAELQLQHSQALHQQRAELALEATKERKIAEENHAHAMKMLREKYEALLRVSDASIQQQQSSLRDLEAECASLHSIIDSHDTKLHELHQAHLQDLHKRLTLWRDTRKQEIQEEEEFLRMKMDALRGVWTKREETLCKPCKQKLGSTSFRAAFNRLCEEATKPSKYRLANTPAALQADSTAHQSQTVPTPRPAATSNTATPATASTQTPGSAAPLSASVRSARVQSDSPTTIAAKCAAGASMESPSPPVFQPSPTLTASARTARTSVHASSASSSSETIKIEPINKQEGVLTLRFHPSNTPASATKDQLVTTSAAFTPAPATTPSFPPSSVTSTPATASQTAATYQSLLDQYLAGAMSRHATPKF